MHSILWLFCFLCIILHFASCQNDYYDEQGWKDASEFILTGLNKQANPCNDFFEFSCGKWAENEGTSHTDENARLSSYTNTRIVQAILDINLANASIPQYAKWLRVFYDQCIKDNSTTMEKLNQLFRGMIRVIGLPPLLSKDKAQKDQPLNRNIWHLQGLIQRELAAGALFETTATKVPKADNQDEWEYVLRLAPTKQIDRINVSSVFKYVKLVANLINVTIDDKELNEKIQNVVNFEQDLFSYKNKSEEAEAEKVRQLHGNITVDQLAVLILEQVEDTIDDDALTELNPHIDWDQYFQGLFSEDQFNKWNDSYHRYVIEQVVFFNELDSIVKRHNVETIFDYTFWKVMNDIYKDFKSNDETKQNAAESCLQLVMLLFSPSAAKVLFDYNKWDVTTWRSDVEMIGETVFAAFKFLVQSVDWLDSEEKMNVITKLNYISFFSGIPKWLANNTEVQKRSFEFESSRGLYDNTMNIRRQLYQASLDRVVNQDDDDENPDFTVNAYYGGMQIEVLLGSLLPPMYHPNYPLSVKYGNIGWTFGHELLHAFDENHIDEVPAIIPFLLKDHSKLSYTQRKSCLIKQMATYCFKEEKKCVNGKVTLGENMADIDGLKIAYMAYKFATQTIGEEPPLPKLFDYSGDQIFFMTAARSYCSNGKELDLFLSEDPDEHSPNSARVEISVRNFQAFAKAFKCVVGSPTAPVKTCSIWGNYYSPKKFLRF